MLNAAIELGRSQVYSDEHPDRVRWVEEDLRWLAGRKVRFWEEMKA